MVSIFSVSRPLRIVLAGAFAVFLFYTLRGDGTSQDLGDAQRYIDAELARFEAGDDRPSLVCQSEPDLFLLEQTASSTGASPRDALACDLDNFRMLKIMIATAEEDLEAGRFETAQRLAMAVLRYNNSVIGRRSLLSVATTSASAKRALHLMQLLAARSTSPEQRLAWQGAVDLLLPKLLDGAALGRAIVLGEARTLRQMSREEELTGGEKDSYRERSIGYARLLRELDEVGNLSLACAQSMSSQSSTGLCSMLVTVAHSQAHIDEDLVQLKAMLAPRN